MANRFATMDRRDKTGRVLPYHAPVSRPLRLAYLADPNSVHTRRWLGFFAERGHEVHLLVGERDEVRDLPDGITLHRYRRFGPRRLPLVSSLQGRGRLRVALRSINPDVLHAHYLTRHGWQARLSGFHPYVASPWGSDLFVTPRESLRARIWAWLTLVGADLVTVVSDHMHDEVARYGVAAHRIERVRFGVDTDRFVPDPSARAPELVGERRFILAPRAIRPIYRPDVVIDAFARLSADVVLVMTTRNADGETLADVERRIARLDLNDRVLLAGEIDDALMLALCRTAEVVISVPESDAIPVSVLEAMSCARPVVATDLPGPRELLGPYSPELLVPVGDVAATTSAIRRALEMSPGARASLGGALRADVVATADRRRNMERMEELYERLRERSG